MNKLLSSTIFFVSVTTVLLACASCIATLNKFDTSCSMAGPSLSVDKTVLNIGQIRTDKIVEVNFLLKNTGISDLIIKRVKTSCGCTTPDIKEGTIIASGESRKLLVKFNPAGKDGDVNNTVLLTTNDESKPETILRIAGYVTKTHDDFSVVPASLRLGRLHALPKKKFLLARFPDPVDFNDVHCFSTTQYFKANVLSVEQVPEISDFDYDIKRISNRNVAVVCVEFISGMALGKISESITIASKSNRFSPVTVPIVGFLEEPLTCELVPSRLNVFFPSEESIARKHLVLYTYNKCKDIALEVAIAPKGVGVTIEKIEKTVGRVDVYIKIERQPEIVFKQKSEVVFRIICDQHIFDRPVSLVTIKQ